MAQEPKSFWGELKQRRVVRVGVAYAVVAWVLVQIAQTVSEVLLLPPWAAQLVLLLVTLGFPLAIVLAWGFQVTPEGVTRAEPLGPGPRARLPFLGGLALGILTVAGLAFVFFGPEEGGDAGATGDALDPDLVAVLPFRASTPEDLSYLGGGVMELLTGYLNGEVGPRSVDPGAAAAAAQRDSSGAISVAQTLGAGLAGTGSVVGDASRLALNAELREVPTGSLVASASAEGPLDSLTTLVDRLGAQLLGLTAGEFRESVASFSSTSPEAVRAYLKAGEAWRSGQYFEAVDQADEAIRLDSTFALAAIRRADAANMATGAGGGGALGLAWRHRARLSPKDLTYLEARRPVAPRTNREAAEAYERAAAELGDRPEAWYFLGETRIHWPLDPGPEWDRRTRAAFERALQLDPGYVPAAQHLMMLAFIDGDPEGVQASTARLREMSPGAAMPFHRGLEDGTGLLNLDVDSLPSYTDQNALIIAPIVHLFFPDQTPDDFIPFVEAAVEEHKRRALDSGELETALDAEYRLQLSLGRPSRAGTARERLIAEFGEEHLGRQAIYSALWDHGSVEEAEATVGAIDSRLRATAAGELRGTALDDLAWAEIWRFARDPSYVGSDAAEGLRSAMEEADRLDALELEAYALLIEAWSRVRGGDPAARSLERIEEILREVYGGRRYLLAAARLLEERGEAERALRVIDRRSRFTAGGVDHEVAFWRVEGRLAVAAGDTARAVRAYERYLKVRQDAEPAVQVEVDAVRAELARIRGG